MMPAWRRVKPGWYLLAVLFLYALLVTMLLGRSNAALRQARIEATEAAEGPEVSAEAANAGVTEPEGLWFPIPGASLPRDPAYLPGAPRSYRRGVSEGFTFYGGDAGIPIEYGTPVIAAAAGTLTRVDSSYQEPDAESWQALLDAVAAEGASDSQLDRLRGRQLWLRLEDGRVLRYGHLAGIRPGLAVDQKVYRGQVIGYVGNSGTDDGVRGTTDGARLHFEIWDLAGYFGKDLDGDAVRIAAAALFAGP